VNALLGCYVLVKQVGMENTIFQQREVVPKPNNRCLALIMRFDDVA
jgi:hypothetical protein